MPEKVRPEKVKPEKIKLESRISKALPGVLAARGKATVGTRPAMWLGTALLLVLLPAVGAACGSSDQGLPRAIQSAPVAVQEAYAYAVEHPEVLRYIPCYCGCAAEGHTSNEDCFIDQRLPDGTVEYDSMGLG